MIKLYSTHCPKCKILTIKLQQKNIDFTEIDDMAVMQSLGFRSAPMLSVDGQIMDFNKALAWIKEQ